MGIIIVEWRDYSEASHPSVLCIYNSLWSKTGSCAFPRKFAALSDHCTWKAPLFPNVWIANSVTSQMAHILPSRWLSMILSLLLPPSPFLSTLLFLLFQYLLLNLTLLPLNLRISVLCFAVSLQERTAFCLVHPCISKS